MFDYRTDASQVKADGCFDLPEPVVSMTTITAMSPSENTTRSQKIQASLAPKSAGWIRWLPGLSTLRRYERSWLRRDLVAGFVMTAMLVPVGIAYAQASGLPGITGLYATIIPLLAYAVFGPSPILILGPDSALAAVILSVVVPLSAGDPRRAIQIGGMMALVSGFLCIAAGLAKLGFTVKRRYP